MPQHDSRRFFLKAALFGSAFTLPGVALAFRSIAGKPDMALPGIFPFDEQLGALGQAYLSEHQSERDSKLLLELVSNAAAGRNLQAVFAKDFRNENTVTVHGWILSRTEARCYALYHLMLNERRLQHAY